MCPLEINSLISWEGSIPSTLLLPAISPSKSGNKPSLLLTSEVDMRYKAPTRKMFFADAGLVRLASIGA